MQIIGLTGGIGVGKSTVSDYLTEKGYRVIDADKMSRQMTAKGSPVLSDIAKNFGDDMILPDGELDRKKLASVVFADAEKKALLEELTTKKVIAQIGADIEWIRYQGIPGITFIDAPLLFECGVDAMTDYVWLITADPEVRISRVMERDSASREEVLDRIRNQMSDEEKKEKSTDILDNSRGKEDLFKQVEDLLEKYEETI